MAQFFAYHAHAIWCTYVYTGIGLVVVAIVAFIVTVIDFILKVIMAADALRRDLD